MFALAVGLMLAVVILCLVYPFLRKGEASIPVGHGALEDQERIDLEIERQRMLASLSELELEKVQGRLSPKDYGRLKATDEYRLVKILERLDQLNELLKSKRPPAGRIQQSSHSGSKLTQWAGPVVLGGVVLGTALGIYSYIIGKIGLDAQKAAVQAAGSAPGGQGIPNPAEMVARLEARLRENPDDLQGQVMAGRSYMALERYEDAMKAWSKVIELNPRSHEAHYHVGVLLLQTRTSDDPQVFKEALDHFDAALINVPREPAVLWYRGVALFYLKRFQEADDSWTTAYQNLMPGTEDAEYVKEALQKLRAGSFPFSQ